MLDQTRIDTGDDRLLAGLIRAGALMQGDAARARLLADRYQLPLADVLLRDMGCDPALLARHLARVHGVRRINPLVQRPDWALVDRFGHRACLRAGILPWRAQDGVVVILTARPDDFAGIYDDLAGVFGPLRMAIMAEAELTQLIAARYGADLALAAETSLPAADSCRDWNTRRVARVALYCLAAICLLGWFFPKVLILLLFGWASLALCLTIALKLAAAIAGIGKPPAPPPLSANALPVITMLVPLFRERMIASHLLVRLAALRYPRARLDICLVLEEDDQTTRDTLARTHLPGWIRAIIVPKGRVQTKPRALNYALPFARGDIIGVWDAEDAPAPDQLHVVARHFAQAPPDVACLQGVLDYYNSGRNWLTRCFTIEYAAWFRVVLPGLARLRLVVPLGGTTLFFRRAALEELGGWDAHNVTEDADLGLRLARRGYRTALIPTVTLEEANGRTWPWVKQRSRWLKGYAITYAVHMRDPALLWRDLGPWGFAGVQVLFLGTLSLFILLPLFWTLWLIPFGVAHPVYQLLSQAGFGLLTKTFIAAELLALAINLTGLYRAGHLRLGAWALTLPLYFPLATIAACRGLAELARKPFYWDKTAHGIGLSGVIPPPRPRQHPVSTA
jgi:cellulose synthase/poly-beta-1,6-N-acetylglucosamine synthase-like glycosyltransferase